MSTFDDVKLDGDSEYATLQLNLHFNNIETDAKKKLKPSRELSLALTNLEQTWLWLGRAIKADQISRTTAKG